MHPIKKAARQAGAVYLPLAILGPFSLIYIPTKLIVRGDAAATAVNITTHEMLFRIGIVADLMGHVLFIFTGFMLYRLLNRVNRMWALLMLGLVLVSGAVGFLNVLNNVAALNLFHGGEFLSVIDKRQRDALAMLFLRLDGHGNYINEMFWGLWLLPLGVLVFRSGFLPRFIGGWLIVNCFAYVALSVTALLFPDRYGTAFVFAQPLLFGEVALILYLLIRGARVDGLPAEPGDLPPSGDEGIRLPGGLTPSQITNT